MSPLLRFPRPLRFPTLGAAFLLGMSPSAPAQRPGPTLKPAPPAPSAPMSIDTALYASMRWREIGPARGGRSVAVAGSVQRPLEYWMGTTGGGVYKSIDGGMNWQPMTDRTFGGTIGAIAVDPRNADVVWVGGGETDIRGNTSHGDGLFKTVDGGRTWTFLAFREEHISTIRIHPTNPNTAYIGVFGNPFLAGKDRGLYKTTDGGKTFSKILYTNDSTGVIDVAMDPSNPEVLYVAMWQAWRQPWGMSSGGIHSAIHKTTDGGTSWVNLTAAARGLPRGVLGKIGLSVSAAKTSRVFAIIEHDSGGVYRSDDAGASWQYLNRDRKLRQRAWYYSQVYADPKDTNVVYAQNTGVYRSVDGGKTFPQSLRVPHGDNHDFWIAPNDPDRMINGDDGGASVSFNRGETWTELDFPTAQFYHVTTTSDWPYNICGAQQDNSTLCGPSRKEGGIQRRDWYDAGGCESGYIASHPLKPNITFAGCYGGSLDRVDRTTGFRRSVDVYPNNPMGESSRDIKVRFQWTFPIVFSRHNPNVLYAGGSRLFRSVDEGQSWVPVSPDLARKDPRTMDASGGPITKDQTGVETYALIFAFDESPVTPGLLWVGTDDGLVWISRDNGANWVNVTPKDIGDFTRISLIEPSRYDAGTAYMAANRYALGDKRPMFYVTRDYGRSWTSINTGIAPDHFARAIREDPVRRGLLYAGTERGVYVSFDDGRGWQPLQMNLPKVPVHDLTLKDNDLVIGTHGRSFWVLDDISALRQAAPAIAAKRAHLFNPVDPVRTDWGSSGGRRGAGGVGLNPPSGTIVNYYLKSANERVQLEFADAQGKTIQSLSSDPDPAAADTAGLDPDELAARGPLRPRLPNAVGLNQFAWNLRYPDAERFDGLIMWAANTTGPVAPPGTYSVKLTVGDESQTATFVVKKDPRSTATDADLKEQFRLLIAIRDKTTEANNAIRLARNMRYNVGDRSGKLSGSAQAEFKSLADGMMKNVTVKENAVYQTKNQSGQDPLNYPIRLNNKIAALAGTVSAGEYRPTKQAYDVFSELTLKLDAELKALNKAMDDNLPRLNAILKAAGLAELEKSTEQIRPKKNNVAM